MEEQCKICYASVSNWERIHQQEVACITVQTINRKFLLSPVRLRISFPHWRHDLPPASAVAAAPNHTPASQSTGQPTAEDIIMLWWYIPDRCTLSRGPNEVCGCRGGASSTVRRIFQRAVTKEMNLPFLPSRTLLWRSFNVSKNSEYPKCSSKNTESNSTLSFSGTGPLNRTLKTCSSSFLRSFSQRKLEVCCFLLIIPSSEVTAVQAWVKSSCSKTWIWTAFRAWWAKASCGPRAVIPKNAMGSLGLVIPPLGALPQKWR